MYCRDKKMTYIYIMYNSLNDLYKIGRSDNPYQREKQLKGVVPEIQLLDYVLDYPDSEKIWHDRFKDERKFGEWFRLDKFQVSNVLALFKRQKYVLSLVSEGLIHA